jgi:iron complex outermembrane receptor protein
VNVLFRPEFLRRCVGAYLLCSAFSLSIADEIETPDQHHDIEEITVRATALARTVEQLAQPTAVLRGDELARKIAPSIGESLSKELGLSSTYFGPVASRPVIRGQFGERVRVLSNGLDSLDASALSEDHQTSVEGILAQRVEIVRGPATLLYGSGASGGLVNVVDNRIIEESPEQAVSGAIALNAADATGELAGAGWVAFGNERVGVHLDYFRRDTQDVDIPGYAESWRLRALEAEEAEGEEGEEARGTIENSDSSTDGGALGLSLLGDRGFLGVSVSTFDSNYGVPGGHGHEEEPGEEEEPPVRIGLQQTRIDLRGLYSIDRFIDEVHLRFAQNDYEHTEFEGGEIGTVFETDGTDTRIELTHKPANKFEGAFGVQFKRIDFNAIGEEAYVPASVTERTSLFAFEEFAATDRFAVQGSVRVEDQSIDGATLSTAYDDTAFSVSLGAVWGLSDSLTLSAHYSQSERHPNSTELYADGAHVAIQRYERGSVTLGNGILEKEKSGNLDLTLRGNTERIDWTVTAFINEIDDYVVLTPTADVEDGFQVFEYEQEDADLYGFEAEARIELMDTDRGHIHTRLFSDYVVGEERGSGEYLPRLPPLRYGVGLHYTIDQVEMIVDATLHEKQSKTAANELPSDSYTLIGAELSYDVPDRSVFLFVKGSNLGNADARQHSSPLKELLPLPGRSLHVGVRVEF